jgi:hypothetical protein
MDWSAPEGVYFAGVRFAVKKGNKFSAKRALIRLP